MSKIITNLDLSENIHIDEILAELDKNSHIWCDDQDFASYIIKKIDVFQSKSKLRKHLKKIFQKLNECVTCLAIYYNLRENITNPSNESILQNFDDERLLKHLQSTSSLSMTTVTEILTYNWKCLRVHETKFVFIQLLKNFFKQENLRFSKMTFSLILLVQCGDSEMLCYLGKNFRYLNRQKLLFLHTGPEEWEYLISHMNIDESFVPSQSVVSKRVWLLSILIYMTLDSTYYTNDIVDHIIRTSQNSNDSNIKEMCFRISAIYLKKNSTQVEKFKPVFESIFDHIAKEDIKQYQGSEFLKTIEVVIISQFKNFCILGLEDQISNYMISSETYAHKLRLEIAENYESIKDIVIFSRKNCFREIMVKTLQQPVLDTKEEKFVLYCIDKIIGRLYSNIRSNSVDLEIFYDVFSNWVFIMRSLSHFHNVVTNFIFLFIYDVEQALRRLENSDRFLDIFFIFKKKIYSILHEKQSTLNEEFTIYNDLIKSDFSVYNIQSIIFTDKELNILHKILIKMDVYFQRFRIFPQCFSRILQYLQKSAIVPYDVYVELFNFVWYEKNIEQILMTLIILMPKIKISIPIEQTFLYNLEWIQVLEKVDYKYAVLLEDFFIAFNSWLKINNVSGLSNHYRIRLKNFAGLYNILDMDDSSISRNDSSSTKRNPFLNGFTDEEMKTIYEQNDANLDETRRLLENAKLSKQRNAKKKPKVKEELSEPEKDESIHSKQQDSSHENSSDTKQADLISDSNPSQESKFDLSTSKLQSEEEHKNILNKKIENYLSESNIVKQDDQKNLKFFNPLHVPSISNPIQQKVLNSENTTTNVNKIQPNIQKIVETQPTHQNFNQNESVIPMNAKKKLPLFIFNNQPVFSKEPQNLNQNNHNMLQQAQDRVQSYLLNNQGYQSLILAQRKKLEIIHAQHESEFTDEFFYWVFSFDFFNVSQFTSIDQIPSAFNTIDEYENTFTPLLLNECKKSIQQNIADRKSTLSKTAFLVEQVSSANYFELVFKVDKPYPDLQILLFSFTDSVLVPDKKIFSDSNYFFGVIIDRKKTTGNHIVVVTKNTIRKPILNSQVFFYDVGCLSSFYREFMALKNMRFFPNLSSVLVKEDDIQKTALLQNTALVTSLLASEQLNISQRNAITHVFMNCLYFSLIHGPPGTGKTQTIVSLVKVLFHPSVIQSIRQRLAFEKEKPRVLICAPSNAAVDEITKRIIDLRIPERSYQNLKVLRIGVENNIHSDLHEYTLDNIIAKEILEKKKQLQIQNFEISPNERMKRRFELLQESDVVCATLSSSARELIKISNISFDILIIDEACQCVETSALIPLKFNPAKVILIGDPKQLPPTVLSQSKPYEQSLFVRLMKTHPTVLLNTQYRMHAQIAEFPNAFFYENLLRTDQSIAERINPYANVLLPISFINIQSPEQMDNSRSFYNMGEANHIGIIVNMLLKTMPDMAYKKIGIITPYKAQQQKIKELLLQIRNDIPKFVIVSTVDGFQGKEMDIILISAVRSKNIGFLNDDRRINVSITRAKFALVIIGNSIALSQSRTWATYIEYLERKKLVFNHYKEILEQK